MRGLILVTALLLAPTLASAKDTPRFAGGGTMVEGAVESSDRRFALKAELQRGDDTQHGGRFSLDAQLAASDLAKSTMAACTVATDIFSNGFE